MSEFLSRKMDYIGELGAKLRDLQGFKTLAYELMQNADDVPQATSMVFDIRDDALIVENDGVFSDCKAVEKSECPWRTDSSKQHRCDFHRFRFIAAGDKRGEAETIGAFGIGFIAVYQITDHPELISGGRHWILHEDRDENQRIEVCSGCAKCKDSGNPGTRFIFPWAFDLQSTLRKALRAETASSDGPDQLLHELGQSIPVAMLFLKRLSSIEVRRRGKRQSLYRRNKDGDDLTLTTDDGSAHRQWRLVQGDFDDAATQLRDRHRGRIEDKRSAKVTVAIPLTDERAGLLCAYLPTEQETGLPFHINADFYPTSDRKRVIFAEDYQSEWNRAAIAAAANALEKSLDILPLLLEAQRFWGFLSSIKAVSDSIAAKQGEQNLRLFWTLLEPRLKTAKIIYTTKGAWAFPSDCALLLQKEETDVIPVLEAMGLNIASEDLRPYQGLLHNKVVGVLPLDIERICKALASHGLVKRVEFEALPSFFATRASIEILWNEIRLLLERQQRAPKPLAEDEQRLRTVAIAPARNGALWPCGQVFSADEETIELFEGLDSESSFVSEDDAFKPLRRLCPIFTVTNAIAVLQRIGGEKINAKWKDATINLERLFLWLSTHRQEILNNASTKQSLINLPIFPSIGRLQPMAKLALSGNFDDQLGLAELVDLSAIGGRRDFLHDLGMPELDFRTYVSSHLPNALAVETIVAEKRRAAMTLLANRLGEIKDDQSVREKLANISIIECTDGIYRRANDCYFESQVILDCLGLTAHFVKQPSEYQTACRDLYQWLGVSHEPRLDDLTSTIISIVSASYSHDRSEHIVKIVAHLGGKITVKGEYEKLLPLSTEAWLPAEGRTDRWYRPNELFAGYQSYLFKTQALFLNVPIEVQRASSVFLESLGIRRAPTVDLVVKHLLHCADQNTEVHSEVYNYLNNNSAEPAVNLLKGKKCLLLESTYYAPSQVYWREHPYGRYRRQLSEELRAYSKLLQLLGVRETPEHKDALDVLKEISAEFGTANIPLDQEAYAVLMTCWQLLETALNANSLAAELLYSLKKTKCIPNSDKVLYPPEWMFFANRAGLAEKFKGFLEKNVIGRPIGASKAMTAAGVRPIGSAVEVHLLECIDPREDEMVRGRIIERRNHFCRILESASFLGDVKDALNRLEAIQCEEASSLTIRYRLNLFNQELDSDPESVPALYQHDEARLLFIKRKEGIAWAAIARELAVALFPEEDPGRIAAGLKEVLSANTVELASNTLDELGYAKLDMNLSGPVQTPVSAGALGVDMPVTDGGASPNETELPRESGELTPEEALQQLLGAGAPQPTPPPPGLEFEPAGNAGVGGKAKAGTGKKKTRPVLRSYIPGPDSEVGGSDSNGDNGAGEVRSPVDLAGVRRVLEYEALRNRNPKEMPHKNPGYDVESRDTSGNVVRYIEVKSFSGKWNYTYAVLSRPQFDKANDLGDSFWLYVVEQAEIEDFKIHPIQNPVGKANHFMFDDGWRSTAENIVTQEEGR